MNDDRTKLETESMGTLAALVPTVGERELRRRLGAELLAKLTPRQRAELRVKLESVAWWQTYAALCGKLAGRAAAKAAFVETASRHYGRRLTTRTLNAWLAAMRRGGAAALVDTRGRPRGVELPDAELVREFVGLLARGLCVAAAHRRVLAQAQRSGRSWPRSVRTLQEWVKRGAVSGVRRERARPVADDPNEYLTRVSAN